MLLGLYQIVTLAVLLGHVGIVSGIIPSHLRSIINFRLTLHIGQVVTRFAKNS